MPPNQNQVNYKYAGVLSYKRNEAVIISKVLTNDLDYCCESIANAFTVFTIYKDMHDKGIELIDVHITNLVTKEVKTYTEEELNNMY